MNFDYVVCVENEVLPVEKRDNGMYPILLQEYQKALTEKVSQE